MCWQWPRTRTDFDTHGNVALGLRASRPLRWPVFVSLGSFTDRAWGLSEIGDNGREALPGPGCTGDRGNQESSRAAADAYRPIRSGHASLAQAATPGGAAKRIAPPPTNGSISRPVNDGATAAMAGNSWDLPPGHFRNGVTTGLASSRGGMNNGNGRVSALTAPGHFVLMSGDGVVIVAGAGVALGAAPGASAATKVSHSERTVGL